MKELPTPVCSVAKLWLDSPIAANYQSRVGVDSYQLQWKGLKPFDDAEVFIAGDTFTAATTDTIFIGWSEGVLLTSERILARHLDIEPYISGLSLHNQRIAKL